MRAGTKLSDERDRDMRDAETLTKSQIREVRGGVNDGTSAIRVSRRVSGGPSIYRIRVRFNAEASDR